MCFSLLASSHSNFTEATLGAHARVRVFGYQFGFFGGF